MRYARVGEYLALHPADRAYRLAAAICHPRAHVSAFVRAALVVLNALRTIGQRGHAVTIAATVQTEVTRSTADLASGGGS